MSPPRRVNVCARGQWSCGHGRPITRDIVPLPMDCRCVPMCGAVLHVAAHDGALRIQWHASARRRSTRTCTPGDSKLLRLGVTLLRRWQRDGQIDPRTLGALLPKAGSFSAACWLAAAQIPRGQTCTYAELAARAGRRGAARAAASAMARNPLPPLVPCHRVVARSGIGGFCGIEPCRRRHWAIRLKHALLERERADAPYTSTPATRASVRAPQRRSHA